MDSLLTWEVQKAKISQEDLLILKIYDLKDWQVEIIRQLIESAGTIQDRTDR
jgi:hypothetical protein